MNFTEKEGFILVHSFGEIQLKTLKSIFSIGVCDSDLTQTWTDLAQMQHNNMILPPILQLILTIN